MIELIYNAPVEYLVVFLVVALVFSILLEKTTKVHGPITYALAEAGKVFTFGSVILCILGLAIIVMAMTK